MEQNNDLKKDKYSDFEVSIVEWQSPRYRIWLKTTAAIVAGVFLLQQVVWAGDIRDLITDKQQGVDVLKQTLEEGDEAKTRQQELLDEMGDIEAAKEQPLETEDIHAQPVSGGANTVTYDDGTNVTYENGRIKQVMDSEGRTIFYTYELDPNNQNNIAAYILQEANGPTFRYDANKILQSISYQDGKTLTYENGMIKKIASAGGTDTFFYHYATFGVLDTITVETEDGDVYTYDADGKIVSVRYRDGRLAAYSNGLLDKVTGADGTVADYSYTIDYETGNIKETKILVGGEEFKYDEAGNISQYKDNAGNEYAYEYNTDGEYESATKTYVDGKQEKYDSDDNLTYEKVASDYEAYYNYNESTGEYTGKSVYYFNGGYKEYDALGNLTYEWNSEDEEEQNQEEEEPFDINEWLNSFNSLFEGRQTAGGLSPTMGALNNILFGADLKETDKDGNGIPDYLEAAGLEHLVDQIDRIISGVKTALTKREQDEEERKKKEREQAGKEGEGGSSGGGKTEPLEKSTEKEEPEPEQEQEDAFNGAVINIKGQDIEVDFTVLEELIKEEIRNASNGRVFITGYTAAAIKQFLLGVNNEDITGLETISDVNNLALVAVKDGDTIGVKYTGRLEDGTVFDSNVTKTELFSFKAGSGQVIEGFDEAVLGLKLGGDITVTIPPEKAYGLAGESSHALAGKTLIFDIKVMEINGKVYDAAAAAAALQAAENPDTLTEAGWKLLINRLLSKYGTTIIGEDSDIDGKPEINQAAFISKLNTGIEYQRDANGRVIGRIVTKPDGTIEIYDADSKLISTTTTEERDLGKIAEDANVNITGNVRSSDSIVEGNVISVVTGEPDASGNVTVTFTISVVKSLKGGLNEDETFTVEFRTKLGTNGLPIMKDARTSGAPFIEKDNKYIFFIKDGIADYRNSFEILDSGKVFYADDRLPLYYTVKLDGFEGLISEEIANAVSDEAAIVEAVKHDLSRLLEANIFAVNIVSLEYTEWNDSALGYPAQGEQFLQVNTHGYKIIAEINGTQYEYHANIDGSAVRMNASLRREIELGPTSTVTINGNPVTVHMKYLINLLRQEALAKMPEGTSPMHQFTGEEFAALLYGVDEADVIGLRTRAEELGIEFVTPEDYALSQASVEELIGRLLAKYAGNVVKPKPDGTREIDYTAFEMSLNVQYISLEEIADKISEIISVGVVDNLSALNTLEAGRRSAGKIIEAIT
ncbi:MAG: FKBP-type peptidyl-prolyl cis-trans isomerase, partial [Candidatus Omnitrophota bacterium]|nr:FKBP-type peptidyl-prolyl cis-trans isomerase [Candidatus Omnitrophota bacterium]